jgi:hypothetical protein
MKNTSPSPTQEKEPVVSPSTSTSVSPSEAPAESGVNIPKKDPAEPKRGYKRLEDKGSVSAQKKRAEDLTNSGLSGSEMVRFLELEHKGALTDDEKQEYADLGFKRDNGIPKNQYDQVRTGTRNMSGVHVDPSSHKEVKNPNLASDPKESK